MNDVPVRADRSEARALDDAADVESVRARRGARGHNTADPQGGGGEGTKE